MELPITRERTISTKHLPTVQGFSLEKKHGFNYWWTITTPFFYPKLIKE